MVIGAYLIMYKSYELLPELLPADLSAVSYFVFAAAAFLPLRRLKCAASFFSVLSGSVYAVTMILFPGEHFGEHTTEFLAGMAMFHHALLLIGGLAMCSLCRPEREKDAPAVLGALALYLAYLGLLWVFDPASASLATAIFGIVDGSLVAGVLGLSVTAGYLAVYILAITLVFCRPSYGCPDLSSERAGRAENAKMMRKCLTGASAFGILNGQAKVSFHRARRQSGRFRRVSPWGRGEMSETFVCRHFCLEDAF